MCREKTVKKDGTTPACAITGASIEMDAFFFDSNNCPNWKLKKTSKKKQGGETLAARLFH